MMNYKRKNILQPLSYVISLLLIVSLLLAPVAAMFDSPSSLLPGSSGNQNHNGTIVLGDSEKTSTLGDSETTLGDSSVSLLKKTRKPILLASSDLSVSIKVNPAYQTFTDKFDNTNPPQLPIDVSIRTNRSVTGSNNYVKFIMKNHVGHLGTPYFDRFSIDDIKSDNPVLESGSIEYKEDNVIFTFKLKESISENSFTNHHLRVNFADEYNALVYHGTEIANFSYQVVSDDVVVSESTTPSPVSADAKPERMLRNMINSTPKLTHDKVNNVYKGAIKPDDRFVNLNDQRIVNQYYYRNTLDPENPPEFNIYFPVGTEIYTNTIGTFRTGDNGQGIFIDEGEIPNVPKGHYYILTTLIHAAPNDKTPGRISLSSPYGGSVYRCERSYNLSYFLPNVDINVTQPVYYSFEYTAHGNNGIREYSSETFHYTMTPSVDWDYYFAPSHTPGLSEGKNKPQSGVKPGDQIPDHIRAAGFNYSHSATQRNQGNAFIENTHFKLYQKTASSNPSYTRFYFTDVEMRLYRQHNRFAWGQYKIYCTIRNEKTQETRISESHDVAPTTKSDSTSISVTPWLNDVNRSLKRFTDESTGQTIIEEYIESFHVIPYGTAENPGEGKYAPRNTFSLAYKVGAWPTRHFPGGDAHTPESAISQMEWSIQYLDESRIIPEKVTKNGGAIDITYIGEVVYPRGQFLSSAEQIHGVPPGSQLPYTFIGHNVPHAIRMEVPCGDASLARWHYLKSRRPYLCDL